MPQPNPKYFAACYRVYSPWPGKNLRVLHIKNKIERTIFIAEIHRPQVHGIGRLECSYIYSGQIFLRNYLTLERASQEWILKMLILCKRKSWRNLKKTRNGMRNLFLYGPIIKVLLLAYIYSRQNAPKTQQTPEKFTYSSNSLKKHISLLSFTSTLLTCQVLCNMSKSIQVFMPIYTAVMATLSTNSCF